MPMRAKHRSFQDLAPPPAATSRACGLSFQGRGYLGHPRRLLLLLLQLRRRQQYRSVRKSKKAKTEMKAEREKEIKESG